MNTGLWIEGKSRTDTINGGSYRDMRHDRAWIGSIRDESRADGDLMVAAGNSYLALARHAPEANVQRQGVAQRLADAAESMIHRFGHMDTDSGKREAVTECEQALVAYRSLPPDARDELLRRAVDIMIASLQEERPNASYAVCRASEHFIRAVNDIGIGRTERFKDVAEMNAAMEAVLRDAERMGVRDESSTR